MNFLSKIRLALQEYKLVHRGDRIVVAVSGGPDSMALLYALYLLRQELGLFIVAGHVHHGLRPQALAEQNMVKKFCQDHFLPFSARRVHIKIKDRQGSLEDEARRKRYAALSDIARKQNCGTIAFAHHQDDLAETVLLHLLRGSGLQGLQGFLPERPMGSFRIIRPFYSVTREEIMAFVRQRNIPYRTDLSNRDLKFFRNRIRRKLIPYLKNSFQSRISAILASAAENITVDFEFLRRLGETHLKRLSVGQLRANHIKINLSGFRRVHPSLQRMIFRLVLERLQNHLRDLTYANWRETRKLINHLSEKTVVCLPGNIQVLKSGKFLVFRKVQDVPKVHS